MCISKDIVLSFLLHDRPSIFLFSPVMSSTSMLCTVENIVSINQGWINPLVVPRAVAKFTVTVLCKNPFQTSAKVNTRLQQFVLDKSNGFLAIC